MKTETLMFEVWMKLYMEYLGSVEVLASGFRLLDLTGKVDGLPAAATLPAMKSSYCTTATCCIAAVARKPLTPPNATKLFTRGFLHQLRQQKRPSYKLGLFTYLNYNGRACSSRTSLATSESNPVPAGISLPIMTFSFKPRR